MQLSVDHRAWKPYNKQFAIDFSYTLKCIKVHLKNVYKVKQEKDRHFFLLEGGKLSWMY